MISRPIDQKVAVAVVFVAAMFMSIMDTSIVNVALPSIGRDFAVPETAIDGISIAYLVSLAAFMPASGWLGNRYGDKPVLMAAISVFTIASILCGVASSLPELVAFRVLQGVGGGMLAPVGTAMLYRAFPPEERVRASAIIIVPTALAPAIAPIIGGLLVTDASWRWVFYVNVPIGVAAVLFGTLFVAPSARRGTGRFDRRGFALSAGGLGVFLYAISEGPNVGWGTARVLVPAALGAGLIVAAVACELHTAEPVLALRLFSHRLLRQATWALVMVSIAFFGVIFAITLYLQDSRGLSALGAGLTQFPSAVGIIVGSQLSSRVIYWRLGPRRHATAGLCAVSLFVAALALLGPHTSLWWVRLILFGLGLSMAQVMIPAQAAAFADVSHADTGQASTLYNVGRQLGGALGVALLTTVIVIVGPTRQVGGHVVAHLAAYHVCFLVAAVFPLIAALATRRIRDGDAARTMVDPRASRARSPQAVVAADGGERAAGGVLRDPTSPAGADRVHGRCELRPDRRSRVMGGDEAAGGGGQPVSTRRV